MKTPLKNSHLNSTIMKYAKLLCTVIAFLSVTGVQAQFLKKLKKKAEQAAERAIERKVEEKTERETEKAFDSTFNNNGKLFKKNKVKPSSSYAFSHKYTMQITQGKETTDLVYYLTNESDYIGTAVEMKKNQEMLTVIDVSKKTIFSFMDFGNSKSMSSFDLDLDEMAADAQEETEMQIEATGNTKTIIGYTCNEYKVTGKDQHGTIWVTQDADVSFADTLLNLKSTHKKSSNGIDQSMLTIMGGLALEMDMVDTSKKKPKTILMQCTALENIDYTIETAPYKNGF